MEYDKDGQPIPDLDKKKELLKQEEEYFRKQNEETEQEIEEETGQETEQQEEVLLEDEVEETVKQEEQPKKSEAEINFARLREKNERLERDNEALIKLFTESQKKSQVIQDEIDEKEEELNDDSFVEPKHIIALQKEIKELKEMKKREDEERDIEYRLKSNYHDFDNVINKKNIDELKNKKPLLAKAILSEENLETRARLVYEAIKDYGIIQKINSNVNKDKERIANNLNKPKSSNSISSGKSESPLTLANSYSNDSLEEARAKKFRLVQEYARKN